MSTTAFNWALTLALPPRTSTAKSLLLVLSFMARQTRAGKLECFPSIDYLVAVTGQNRKTLARNLDKLERWGLLLDTGRRMGVTRQVVVYRLHIRERICTRPPPSYAQAKKRRPKTAEKSPKKALEESQTRATESNRNMDKKIRALAREDDGVRDVDAAAEDGAAGTGDAKTQVQSVIDALARTLHPHRYRTSPGGGGADPVDPAAGGAA